MTTGTGAPRLVVTDLGKRYVLGKAKPGRRRAAGRDGNAKATKRRDRPELWALREVSFAVRPGTVLGVIGPNGAGKSTLLKILARVTPPTEGRVVGRGRVVSLLELGAAFQPDLTARQNIYLNAAMNGHPKAVVDRRIDEIIAFAELARFIDNPVRQFSSGMYLRLAFSSAIHLEPDILLADEVLAVGDAAFQARCLERVRDVRGAGASVLFVSHDMAAIAELCDEVLWLQSGHVAALGPPESVIAAYQESSTQGTTPGLPASADRQGNERPHGAIVDVRLASVDGEQLGALRRSEIAVLEIAFQARRPTLALRFGFDAYVRGTHVFRSRQDDSIDAPEPGTYVARAVLPRDLLAETVYDIHVSVTVHEGDDDDVSVLYNALQFRVYGSSTSDSTERQRGLIAPKLEWAVLPPSAERADVVQAFRTQSQ